MHEATGEANIHRRFYNHATLQEALEFYREDRKHVFVNASVEEMVDILGCDERKPGVSN
ncbi:MAG: hypothetical protein R3C24_19960 [Cyanobacteriota/Melainabacteria group bacterium]